MSEQPSVRQLNQWANRALENVQGGWYALAEHQLRLIAEATGGIDPVTIFDHGYRGNAAEPCRFSWWAESRTYCEQPREKHRVQDRTAFRTAPHRPPRASRGARGMAKTMTICEDCGMRHELNDKAACIEGHGGDPLDVRVARALGHTVRHQPPYGWDYRTTSGPNDYEHWARVPPYSSDIGAAWVVVEAVRAQAPFVLSEMADASWCCELGSHKAFGETPMLAICRAALMIDIDALPAEAAPGGEGE